MKKGAFWSKSLFGSLLSIVLLDSCFNYKPVEFKSVNSFNIENISSDSATLSAQLVFFNPNNTSLNFKNLDCDVFANEKLVGHFSQEKIIAIPAKSDFSYPAQMKVDLSPILKDAVATFLSGSVNLHLIGKAKVGIGNFYLSVPIDYSKDQKLSF